MTKPKILLWDLETSYKQVLTFGIFKQNINHDNIVVDNYIHCVSYSWHHEKKIHCISQLDSPDRWKKDKHDDYHVVKEFRKVIEQADAHVAHNGNRFDLPMLQNRIILNDLDPLPNITSIDTYNLAKKARFSCRKLDYLSKQFGHDGKIDNPKGLWRDCFNGDEKAMRHMAKYNKVDIEALRVVFDRLMPYAHIQTLNANHFDDDDGCPNPVCGGENIRRQGHRFTATGKYPRYKCFDCGKWFQGKSAVATVAFK